MIKVMVVDDQILLKETLLFMLNQNDDIEAMDGGNNGYEAIDNCYKFRPHIIIMDLKMPLLDGIEATKKIKNQFPSVKVIILTTFEEEEDIIDAISNYADGYIIKDIKPEALVLTVRSVFNDLYVLHKSVVKLLKKEINNNKIQEENSNNVITKYNLTPIDIKIIKFLADGLSNREIAIELNFSVGTIKNKVSRLLSKLEVKDRTQVAVFAIKNNLI